MRQAIIDKKKCSTTRDHQIPLGLVKAVSGSRFKAEPFAILEILTNKEVTVETDFKYFWDYEGFDSEEAMREYCRKEKLLQDPNAHVWLHIFRVMQYLEVK